MSEWRSIALQDLCDDLTVGHVGPMASEYVVDGIPFLRSQNVRVGRLELRNVKHISADFHQRLRKSQLRPGDIVIVRTGDPGAAALIPPSLSELNCADLVIVHPGPQVDSRFLCYSINATARHYVDAHLVGAVQQHFNVDSARRLKLKVPSLQEQKAVASLLGALDDKITVNDRIASVSDRLSASILDQILTTDKTGSNVLLSDIAHVNQRKVIPVSGGYLRYVDISSVSSGSVEWPARTPWSEAPSRARRGVSPGDTIWSTVRPGRRSYALLLKDDQELVVSTGFAVLTPVKVGPAFLYEITTRDEFVRYLESVSEGSAYPTVRAERFEQATVPLPSPDRLQHFEEVAMSLRQHVKAVQSESRVLAELRDTLLPKLMSGEIRVRQAERIVEGAT
jgi:type I restriction enzyme, S subunit